MSAYVVDKETIDTLISAALRAKLFGREEATEKGQMLWRENVTSVSYRYNLPTRDATELAQYEGDVEAYEFAHYDVTGPKIVDAIDCLDYQSCEHDGWEASAAYALLGQLRLAFPPRRDGFEDAATRLMNKLYPVEMAGRQFSDVAPTKRR
jgi:hypothetical protein